MAPAPRLLTPLRSLRYAPGCRTPAARPPKGDSHARKEAPPEHPAARDHGRRQPGAARLFLVCSRAGRAGHRFARYLCLSFRPLSPAERRAQRAAKGGPAMSEELRGYQGYYCNCKACRGLTDEERAAKHQRIQEARRRGGQVRAAQPSMQEARRAGFWRTMELHPFFCRKWLRKKIKAQNVTRQRRAAMRSLIGGRPTGRRRPMK